MSTSTTPAADTQLYLGLDFGTSGARASLIDDAGKEVFQHGVAYTDNTWQEWQSALQQLLGALPVDLRPNIRAIALCGTSGTSLLCDHNGAPLLPAILYHDQRARAEAATLPPHSVAASASSSLAKLLWLRQQPQAADAQYFMHQADWLAFLLHGQPGISDYHNSLKLGYDIAALEYPDWMRNADYVQLLPVVLEPGSVIGTITAEIAQTYHLPADCVVRASTTDSIAAFFASGADRAGQAVTSLGSTLVLKLLSTTRVESPEHGIYSHRCGTLWLAGGASNCGGQVLQQIFGRERLQQLSTQLHPDQPTGLDYYPLPAPGERFPHNDPALAPRLEPRPADDAVYLQGLLESLARIEARGYRLLAELGATPLQQVYSAGGGAGNAAWSAIRARELGVPPAIAAYAEAAYGAARLARGGEKLLYSAP